MIRPIINKFICYGQNLFITFENLQVSKKQTTTKKQTKNKKHALKTDNTMGNGYSVK